MPTLAVITPSYAPDLELCRDLNASVLAHTPASTVHYIITPQRDLSLFSALQGQRTHVWSVDQLIPRYFVGLPRANFWLNLRRPVPPVRGWVMQQVVKLQVAAQIEADVLLSVDSDVVFVRPATAETFQQDGRICLYRKDAGVDESLPAISSGMTSPARCSASRAHSPRCPITSSHPMSGTAAQFWPCRPGSNRSPGGPECTRLPPGRTSQSARSTACSSTKCLVSMQTSVRWTPCAAATTGIVHRSASRQRGSSFARCPPRMLRS
jgi:hypothetical protein